MKENVVKIIEELKKMYPDAKCSLDFSTPFEMGIAVMLSAQCTDERVNKITPILFEKYKKPEDYVKASLKEIEEEPSKIEQDLIKQIPKKYFKDVNHLLVWHGRQTCNARKPKCEECRVNKYCELYNKL